MDRLIQNILEVWGVARIQEFSRVMAREELYFWPFILMIALPLVALFLYYKVMDSISGANAGRWLLYGLASALLVCLISFFLINSTNSRYDLGIVFSETFRFLFVPFGYAMLLYIIGSFGFRYWSTHRRYVPV